MVMEIQVFYKCGVVEPGKYEARLLTDDNKLLLFGSLRNWPAQIISGPHAGKVIPHANYIKTSDLPASSEMQLQNTRMIEQLAEAARKIASCNNRTQQLEEELRVAGVSLANQQNDLEALRNSKRVELPKEIFEALENCAAAGLEGFSLISYLPVINQLFRDYDPIALTSMQQIKDFCRNSTNKDLILKAMVFGYTVAAEHKENETDDTVLLAKAADLVWNWWNGPAGQCGDKRDHTDTLAKGIVEFIRNYEGSKRPF